MKPSYDETCCKKPINPTLNSVLLMQTKAPKTNYSATLEQVLTDAVSITMQHRWLQENQAAIKHYNEMLEKHGCFAHELILF